MKALNIGIVGATGVVGREITSCLYKYGFKNSQLSLMASRRSAGKRIKTPFGNLAIKAFSPAACRELDLVFLCVGGEFAKTYARDLAKHSVVIDNSSAFRYEADVPLVVPQINPQDVNTNNLIANPNCTTAVLAMALWPLYKRYGLRHLVVSTYQAVSGAGKEAMDELLQQQAQMANGKKPTVKTLAVQISQNLIPRIDNMQANGYTKEEMKVAWETQKMFHNKNLKISCSAVRVPTLRAHAVAATLVTKLPVPVSAAKKLLAGSPGVRVFDEPEKFKLPMPITATSQYDVQVGRLRHNLIWGRNSLDFFVCGDQLLRGAALNAVEIAKVRFGGHV